MALLENMGIGHVSWELWSLIYLRYTVDFQENVGWDSATVLHVPIFQNYMALAVYVLWVGGAWAPIT